jgi:hypothetical protein
MEAKQRNIMQHMAASPRGYELEHAADFVRIREWRTLSATSATGHFRMSAGEVERPALPPSAAMPSWTGQVRKVSTEVMSWDEKDYGVKKGHQPDTPRKHLS